MGHCANIPVLKHLFLDLDETEVGGIAEATQGDEHEIRLKKRVRVMHFATALDRLLITIAGIGNAYNGAVYPLMLLMVQGVSPEADGSIKYMPIIMKMIMLAVINFFCGFIAAAAAEFAAERQVRRMKLTFLNHLLSQEIAYFDKFDALALATRLNFQTAAVRRSIGQKLAQMALFIGLIVMTLGSMFYYALIPSLMSLLLFPLIIATGWWAAHVDKRADVISQQAFASAASVANEALANIKTVKAFALEDMMTSRFGATATKALRASVSAGFIAGLAMALHWAMLFLTFGFALWFGVRRLLQEHAKNPDSDEWKGTGMLTVFTSIIMISFAISKSFPTILSINKAKHSMRQILQIYARQSKINPEQTDGVQTPIRGEFVFSDASFKYSEDAERHVFQALNLKIPAGKSTALVGASGSGKSTIVQLIERFYDLTGGSLTVDGVPIQQYNVSALRGQIALVSQEPRLFSDTIAANIGCAKEGCSRDEIIACAKQANAHDFIMQFPDGYDTWVGEGGGQLSGGQKQRIAIARALLRDPRVLILDEATSALDNVSEKMVQDTCNRIVQEGSRTTIIIAHRLSTVRNADRIVVLDNPDGEGAIVAEEGSHEELLRMPDGLYAALVAAQTGGGDLAPAGAAPSDKVNWALNTSTTLALRYSKDLTSRASSLVRLQSKFSSIDAPSRHLSSVLSKGIDWNLQRQGYELIKPKYYRRTVRLVRQEWYWMLLALVGSVLAGFVWPFVGWSLAGAVACFFYSDPNQQHDESIKYAGFYYGMAAVAFISIWVSRTLSDKMAATLTKRVRVGLFENVTKKTVSFFDSPMRSPGALVNILAADVRQLGGWGGANVAAYCTTVFVFLVAIIISLNAQWRLGLVALAGTLILAPISWVNSSLMRNGKVEFGRHKLGQASIEQSVEGVSMSRSEAIMSEAVLNIRTITAYNLQEVMSARYKAAIMEDFYRGRRAAIMTGVTWGLSQCTIMGILILCIWYAFKLFADGMMDVWALVRSIMVLLMASFNMGAAFTALSEDSKARVSAVRIYGIMDEAKPFDEYATAGTPVEDIEAIKFDHVAFRYLRRPELPIYRDVTFTIPKGMVVALVGSSGCGKSTAIQLIQHLYAIGEGFDRDEKMGHILLNGKELATYNIQTLRQQIGIVSQEPSLFWGTIEENIGYGNPRASPEDIRAAAKAANALEFIEKLPDGIQTDVGRGGAKLSGGQKQRIAIARALLRKPKLLILDEATSALDAESERVVQATLDKLLATREFTTIMIAHRLSTIRKADRIVVLVNGDLTGSVVAEVGRHDDLMKIKDGVYRGLVRIAENK